MSPVLPFKAREGFDASDKRGINLADPQQPTDFINLRSVADHRVWNLDNLHDLWDDKSIPLDLWRHDMLAFVKATGTIYRFTGNPNRPPTNRSEGLEQWEAIHRQVHLVDTEANLPSPGIKPIDNGDVYLIRNTVDGKPLQRLYVWDDDLLGPGQGYWRPLVERVWTKATQADPNQVDSVIQGDLQATIEKDHKELKIFDNAAGDWIDLFTEDDIRAWIAALSLFRGTVAQVGGAAPGVIEVTGLPDLLALTTAGDTSETAHYWIWQGTDGYVIPNVGATDEIGGGLSADLHGARLNVGDWLQISDRGTPGHPDLHWVRVGGDLMTRKRWGDLTVVTWTAGAHERGTIAVYDGKLYRASRDVTAQDPSPKPSETLLTLPNRPPDGTTLTGNPLDQLPVAGTPGLVNGYLVHASAAGIMAGGGPEPGGGNYASGEYFVWSDNPAFAGHGTTKEGLPFDQNWIRLGMTLPSPITVTAPPLATPWQEIPLAGGVKTVAADVNLPTSNVENGELFLIINSAVAGNNPRMVMWDQPHTKWVDISGGAIKNHATPNLLPTTNVADGDIRLILDTGAPHHRAGLYYYDGTNQSWQEICCAIPLALSAGEIVYPDVIQMGGNVVGTAWEGQMWHAPLSDAVRKMEPVQIYRERQWEFITGWGWQTLGAGTLFPAYFSANPSNGAKPSDRVYVAFQYYAEWVAPFYKKTANGDWHRLRQNILDNYVSAIKRNAYTSDIYNGTLATETVSNLQAGDVLVVIATVSLGSTAAANTRSTGRFRLNIAGAEVDSSYVDLASGEFMAMTLHHAHHVAADGALTLSVTYDGFSHSVRAFNCKITAFPAGSG